VRASARRRALRSRLSARLPLRDRDAGHWDEYAQSDDSWTVGPSAGAPGTSGSRARERTAARPITAQQRAITSAKRRAVVPVAPAAPLAPRVLPTDSVPRLAAFRPTPGLLARVPAHTRAILQRASRPWSVARLIGVVVMIVLAVAVSLSAAGEGAQSALAAPPSRVMSGGVAAPAVDANVVPITQLIRCDEYDSYAQCQEYGNAACSAAATTEVLTAWGVPNITIGRVIDEMGSDISSNGGLLTHAGFERAAAKHGFRADLSDSLTYNQILYLANTQGWPVIVDVRISYGYYHFLSGGHFLVVTGGNANGLSIADSSEYYIHYLPKDVFYSMFTGATTLFVPQNMQYTLPNS
jgi:hypothetical protein